MHRILVKLSIGGGIALSVLAFAGGLPASASADVFWYDTDGDGIGDTGYADSRNDGSVDVIVGDHDQNGIIEVFSVDLDNDGYLEATGWDRSANGTPEELAFDTDLDGYWDYFFVDNNENGIHDPVDVAFPTSSPAQVPHDDPGQQLLAQYNDQFLYGQYLDNMFAPNPWTQ